jgi:carbamoyl-phosphate synthase large subunit
VIPAMSLGPEMLSQVERATEAIALRLGVIGLINIQFAVYGDEELYVIEANPRASRTVPFVSKAIGVPLAKIACRLMLGERLADIGLEIPHAPRHVSVKEAVLPFGRFPRSDALLGPEMKSTGEVMGIDKNLPMAFVKSQMAASAPLPATGTIFISVARQDKAAVAPIAKQFAEMGYKLIATSGTGAYLQQQGIPVEVIPKIQEGRPNLLDKMKNAEVALIINTPSGRGSSTDEGKIRSSAVTHRVTCITTLSAAHAAVEACRALREQDLTVTALQDWFPKT